MQSLTDIILDKCRLSVVDKHNGGWWCCGCCHGILSNGHGSVCMPVQQYGDHTSYLDKHRNSYASHLWFCCHVTDFWSVWPSVCLSVQVVCTTPFLSVSDVSAPVFVEFSPSNFTVTTPLQPNTLTVFGTCGDVYIVFVVKLTRVCIQ